MLYDGRHNDVRRDTLTITADDGRALPATWYEPIGVAPAFGVSRRSRTPPLVSVADVLPLATA